MLVSIRHRLVALATPKCASTAIEEALAPHMDVVIRGHPGAKHTNYRRFDRQLRRYLEAFADGRLETVCLSASRSTGCTAGDAIAAANGIPDPAKSTRAIGFDAFVTAYLDGAPGPSDLGRQSRFVADAGGSVGVDRIFRHDHLDRLAGWLGERLGVAIALDRLNVSPPAHGPDALSPATAARARAELARDYEIYAGAE